MTVMIVEAGRIADRLAKLDGELSRQQTLLSASKRFKTEARLATQAGDDGGERRIRCFLNARTQTASHALSARPPRVLPPGAAC
jgi:hypothetical protein